MTFLTPPFQNRDETVRRNLAPAILLELGVALAVFGAFTTTDLVTFPLLGSAWVMYAVIDTVSPELARAYLALLDLGRKHDPVEAVLMLTGVALAAIALVARRRIRR